MKSVGRSIERIRIDLAGASLALAGLLVGGAAGTARADSAGEMFFEKNIRPILVERCYSCHSTGAKKTKGGLDLESAEGVKTGGDRGTAVEAGKPDESLLIQAVRYSDPDLRMPPKSKLPDREIQLLTQWVKMGAPDTRVATAKSTAARGIDLEAGRKFWAFRPPVEPTVPTVRDRSRPWTTLDRFVVAALEAKGLKPVTPADKRKLIRRATLDLTGLPPAPDEVAAFLADTSPRAYERVVDRLLASPRYGERWGRHWLDVARYADSNGLDENVAHGNAWRYRDYVVAAFNSDKPYDQFVIEQLAGDLLPGPADGPLRHERLVATGFLALGPKVLAEVDETKMEMDIVDEQIDTVGKAFLGLTLGCARCHDHKFDPLATADYYGLAGIFRSTKTMESFKKVAKWHENPLNDAVSSEKLRVHGEKIKLKNDEIAGVVADETARLKSTGAKSTAEADFAEPAKAALKKLRGELAALEKAPPDVPSAMGVAEAKTADTRVHIRGNHLALGDLVPRRVPLVLTGDRAPSFPTGQSGRLELAKWIVDPANPLSARVMVNRVWRWHFGRGLVASTDNFGKLGGRPSHPELLDWLALRFVESGWSIKQLHRLIMTSEVYRLSSSFDADASGSDPENIGLWRFRPRRMEAEGVRDSLLFVSGAMDGTVGGSLLAVKNRDYFFDHTSKDKTSYETNRRSIYLPVVRNHLYDGFDLFDYNDAGVSTGDRASTTVAPQALFLLNSDLILDSAAKLADVVLATDGDETARLTALCLRAFGRPPDERELSAYRMFLKECAAAEKDADPKVRTRKSWAALCQAILMSNEFIYID